MGEAGELIVSIIGDMEQLHKVFNEIGNEISGIGDKFSKMGKDLSSSGADLTTGVTAPIVATGVAIGATVAKATEFDTGMRRVATMLPGLTEEGFTKISGQALQLSKDFGSSTSDMTDAMYQALSSGVPQDNIFSFMQEAEKLAIGGATDVVTATDVLTNSVNAYGAANLSTAEASDILFQGTKFGKSTVEELAATLANVVPSAAQAGISFADVNAALAAMTIQGTPTAQATTQLRAIIDELTDTSSDAAAAFQALSGQSFREFIASGGTVGEAIQILNSGVGKTIVDQDKLTKINAKLGKENSELAKTFQKLTGESYADFIKKGGTVQEAASMLGLEFGTQATSVKDYFSRIEAGNGALELSGNGFGLYQQALEGTTNAAGSTDEAYKTMSEGMEASLNRIKSSFEGLAIKLGTDFIPLIADTLVPLIEEDLIPFLEAVEPVIKSLADGFNALPGPIKLIAIGAVALLAALGPILMIIGSIATGVGALVGLFGAGGALATAGAAVGGLVAALLPLAPALLAIIVVAGLVYAVFKNWDKIKEFAEAPLLYAEQAVYHTIKYIEKIFGEFDLSDILANVLFPGLAIVDQIFGTDFIDTISEAMDNIWSYLEDLDFKELGKDVFNALVEGAKIILLQQPYKLVYTIFKKTWDYINTLNLSTLGKNVFNRLIDGIKKTLESEPYTTVKDKLQAVWDYLDSLTLADVGRAIFNTLIDEIKATLMMEPLGTIKNVFLAVINYLGSVDLGAEAQKIFDKFITTAKSVLTSEPLKSITAAMEAVYTYLATLNWTSAGSRLINGLINTITNLLDEEPLATINTALSKIRSAITYYSLADAAKSFITSLKNGVYSLLETEPISTVKTAISKISSYIYNFDLLAAGRSFINRLVSGVNAIIDEEPISTIRIAISKISSYIQNFDLAAAGKSFIYKMVSGIYNLMEKEPMATISSAIYRIYSYLLNYDLGNAGTSLINKLVAAIKLILKTEPFASIYSAINSAVQYIFGIDLATAGTNIIKTLANGIRSAGHLAYEAVQDILQSISNLLPHSPAKEGPFRVLPNWDAIFVDPTETSLQAMRGTVLSGLDTVADVVNSSKVSSNITNQYGGDTISIGPNTLSNGVDIKKIIDELNKYTTNQKRARGLI